MTPSADRVFLPTTHAAVTAAAAIDTGSAPPPGNPAAAAAIAATTATFTSTATAAAAATAACCATQVRQLGAAILASLTPARLSAAGWLVAGAVAAADPLTPQLPDAAAPSVTAGTGLEIAGELEQQVRQLALSGTPGSLQTPGTPGSPRVEVNVGQLDPRLHLAPCQHVEPYLPQGTRPWGKSRIGLRCIQGPTRWNVYLPITVRVFGTALVATSGVAAGSVLSAADLMQAEVDLAEDASAAVGRSEAAVGRTLARALQPGQSLRLSHLKTRQWFSAGEMVTVLAQGNGFSVASEAQALNNGLEGQPVRVRTESGRVLTGLPVGERRVELGR